jgi:NAD(P)-dependent dehydrogenase (short-subunit alcohol dehydrogenase family)
MKLEGRVALVTGASRGVGQATAIELARRGADLILSARTVDAATPGMPGTLAETAAVIRSLGRDAHVVGADLNATSSVERLAEQALAWRGVVDVLVNDAAFLGRAAYHDLDELELKNFERQFRVNVTAPFLLSKLLVPAMRGAGGGVIVNVTSGAGIIGAYTTPGITYGATKAALNRLSTLVARDLRADNIAVFSVDPGYTRTVLVEQTAEQAGQDLSTAHSTDVPAGVIAALIEADIDQVTGKVWRSAEGRGPILMVDSHLPMPEGIEVDLSGPIGDA